MGRCRFRPVAYRLGLVFLTLGFLLVAVGYGAPAWVRNSTGSTFGLWHACTRDWSTCHFQSSADALLMAVRAVVAACLFFYIVAFAMALRENCCSPNFYTCCLAGRKTEVFAFLAELLGIAGMVLFSIDEYEHSGNFRRLSWAHALCDFGLAVSLIGSIMMACAQQTLPAAKAAAGRIVANPLGYESLANNRSASLHSRSTQPSPFQGRTTPVISGPYPSAAAAAAANAIVSPKQNRNNGRTQTTPQQKKQTSPYPTLESQSSPSRRRKSSGQEKQFAGVHNQGKHPPVFASQHVQEEWEAQQSGTWTEEQEHEEDGVRMQRALKAQMEQQQRHGHSEHTNTWTSGDEREGSRIQHVHTERQQHQENQWQARTHSEQHVISHNLPPPPVPPAQYDGQGRQLHNYHPSYPSTQYTEYVQEGRPPYQDYPNPMQGYLPEHANIPYQAAHSAPQQRPDSGNFPDPPPPEQLLCYEEERAAEPGPYPYPPYPGAGTMADRAPPPPVAPKTVVQPMVMYRAPSHPGQSPVTETVAIRPHDPHNSPHASPRVPAHHHPHHQYQHHYHQQQLPPDQPLQHHATFPRQTPAQVHHDPNYYSTFGR